MFLLRLILVTLPFVRCTFGRVIISSKYAPEEEENRSLNEILFTDGSQSFGTSNNMIKILTNGISDGSRSFQEQDEDNSSPKRTKRRFHPTLEDSNNWRANIYSIQSPYFVSINEFEDSNPSFDFKYNYYNSVDMQKNTTERMKRTSQLSMNSDNLSDLENVKPKKPVWDVTDFKATNGKNSRPSRASKRELAPGDAPSPFFILEDIEESESSKHLTQQYMDRNEIPPVPFMVSTSTKPSKCAWAILSCCSTTSEELNHKCFREMECEEKYWNVNICSEEFKSVAILTAYKYYNGNINNIL
ncbi:uncharacterized protein LOC123676119 [Harmonia axyridis]|uniref:uncharacterized protein LOC123676119 n=1 Tax=Harmonia axyridis TaxID=115357 RepID=UPI001E278330|nr:uncharacterized protein LOC123676119 [Harmonia axyridis]XP_045467791.1 uncharacterized protein LOC123676119 [Harmonia axyridis]